MDDDVARSVESTAEVLLQTLRLARALVEARRPVELDGFDRQVGLLCAKAIDLPPEFGHAMRPRLAWLLTEVDSVVCALKLDGPPQ